MIIVAIYYRIRSQESGVRSQESGVRSQESGGNIGGIVLIISVFLWYCRYYQSLNFIITDPSVSVAPPEGEHDIRIVRVIFRLLLR